MLFGEARVALGQLGLFGGLGLNRLLLLGELTRPRTVGLGLLTMTSGPFAETLPSQLPAGPCPPRDERRDHEQDDHDDHQRHCQSG